MEEIDLKEVFSYFKSKLLGIIIVTILIVAGLNAYTILTRKPLYNSNTTIVLVSSNKKDYNQIDAQLNKNLIGTYTQIIKSRKVLNTVNDNLELKYSYKELSGMVSVTAVEESDLIKITVSSENKEEAAEIANEIAKVFTKEVQNVYNLENIYTLDKANISKEPYNINYIKDNIIYLAIGLVLTCGVVFIMYYFDTTLKSSEVVEDKFDLPVLGIVPLESRGK